MKAKPISLEDYGALGDGRTDCTAAIQATIDAVCGNDACRVVEIPAGIWLSGTLTLRSGITVHLAKGAVLKAIDQLECFPHITHPTPSRMDLYPWRAFIFGHGLNDLTLCGEGRIEAGGEYTIFHDGFGDSPDRPYGLHLIKCRNLRIEGLQLRNSAHWMMRLLECSNVRVNGLTIYNHSNHNNDGMDIDSCNGVMVSDCIIDSADDALCLKSETTAPCRNILISNCLLSSHASAIKLGTASIGGFENIQFSNCSILPSSAKVSHHPFNLPKGMTGIDVGCVDGGTLCNLVFEDITMDGILNPIFVKLGQRYSTGTIPRNRNANDAIGPRIPTQGRGSMHNLSFRSIHAVNAGPLASMIFGSPDHPIQDVTLRDIRIECRPPAQPSETKPDWSPTGYPCAVTVAGKDSTPAYGFHLRYINHLVMENVVVTPDPGDSRSPIDAVAVSFVKPDSKDGVRPVF